MLFLGGGGGGCDFEVPARPKPCGVYSAEMMAGTQGTTWDSALWIGAVEEGRGLIYFSPSLLIRCTPFTGGNRWLSEKSDVK